MKNKKRAILQRYRSVGRVAISLALWFAVTQLQGNGYTDKPRQYQQPPTAFVRCAVVETPVVYQSHFWILNLSVGEPGGDVAGTPEEFKSRGEGE